MASLLAQVRDILTVDVDSMDPAVAARHTTESVKFCDMTSNQAIVYTEAAKPDGLSVLKDACARVRDRSAGPEQQVSDALDLLVCATNASMSLAIEHSSRRCSWPSRSYPTSPAVFMLRPRHLLRTIRIKRSLMQND